MKRKNYWWMIACAALLVALLAFGVGCAKKSSGGGDDDDDDDDDDDATESGVGSYDIYLNMVPVTLGEFVEPSAMTLTDPDGAEIEVSAIGVADLLAAIPEFSADAAKFTYEIFDTLENALGDLASLDDLGGAAFYEHPDGGLLCLGWTGAGHSAQTTCAMDNGALVTHPIDGQFDITPIATINERTGDQPDMLGQTTALQGVITCGTGVMVSGSYLKSFVQEDGSGVKIFADMGATDANAGYNGQLMSEIYLFEGDEVFIQGRVTVHNGMIEFVPVSGYHVAVLSTGNDVPAPAVKTIAELIDDKYFWAGALVQVEDVEMVDVNPDDPTTDWPAYGTKSKDIMIRHTSGGQKIALPVYEGTGIPGSIKPAAGFDVIGLFNVEGEGFEMYPRKIEDVNPTDTTLGGTITVQLYGEDKSKPVNLSQLRAGMQVLVDGEDPVPVVSIASVINASGISRNYKKLEYKHIAYDGRQPFETLIFDEMKSGVLYQDEPQDDEQPDPMVSSFFWEGMGLSEIYFLNGVTDINAIREVEPPAEGDAEHGKGVTLMINGKKYAINFNTLTKTEYEGEEAIRFDNLIHEQVINLYTMDGSFTTDQIRMLYDYRLASYDESQETTVTYDDLDGAYLVLADPPYSVFPELGESARIDDLYVIDMMRMMQVDNGLDKERITVYLRDCATESVDVGDGVMEDVVFFRTVLEEAGVDIAGDMYLWDVWLTASDDFTSTWTYGHNHLVDMYFRPYENRGWTVDEGLAAYGGRVSTKAIDLISLHAVPQEAPSEPVVIGEQTLWGSSANSCEGCHFKHDAIQIPIDCYSCHSASTR